MQTYLIKDGKGVIFKSFTKGIIILPLFFIAKILFMQFLFLLTLPTSHNHQNVFFFFQQIPSYIYILKSDEHKSPPKLPRVWHVLRRSAPTMVTTWPATQCSVPESVSQDRRSYENNLKFSDHYVHYSQLNIYKA